MAVRRSSLRSHDARTMVLERMRARVDRYPPEEFPGFRPPWQPIVDALEAGETVEIQACDLPAPVKRSLDPAVYRVLLHPDGSVEPTRMTSLPAEELRTT